MALAILLALIAVPLVEIAVFIKVGGMIGLLPTIALCILSAMVGAALLRRQGLATLRRARETMDQGIFPVDEVFDGFCILLAGALLLTPGFVTDFIGLMLFLPPVRRWFRALMARHMAVNGGHRGPARSQGPRVIEADYEDITLPGEPPRDRPRDRSGDR